jgi:hypothetical protein
MEYYKIIKLELIEGVLTHSPIGYISHVNKATFELIHGKFYNQNFNNWIVANPELSIEVYFESNDPCYLLDCTGFDLPEGETVITNLITLV